MSEKRYIICEKIPTNISSLGAIKKSDDSVRLIRDCVRPSGKALNDYAELERQFKHQSVDTFIFHRCSQAVRRIMGFRLT